jgi:hypothetical protein
MMSRISAVWQRPLVRKIAAVLIFLGAVSLQVFFKNFPWPLSLESTDKLKSPSVLAGAQELVLGNATVKPKRPLLSYKSSAWETADLDLGRARLDDQSAAILSISKSGSPPSSATTWAYVSQESESSAPGNPCRTEVDIGLDPAATQAGEFHFSFRLEPSEASSVRRLEIRSDNVPLQVRVFTDQPKGPLCIKNLQAGAWRSKAGNIPITFLADPGSNIRITFLSESDKAPSWQPDGMLRLEFGPMTATQLAIRQVQDDGSVAKAPPAIRISTFLEKPITTSNLALGADALQVRIAGRAWASQDGKPVGFDVIDAMQKNLAFGALLAAGNLAFLAWLKKLVFGAPTPAAGAPAEASSSERSA